jgi:CRISPR-associated protein Cas5t
VGASGAELQKRVRGQKYSIAPVRREYLVGAVWLVGVRGPNEIVDCLPRGLAGELQCTRYGLPFAGDNQLLFNRIEIVAANEAAWFIPLGPGNIARGSTRLTTLIDRRDSSRTKAPLFAPTSTACPCPAEAWVTVSPAS